ncbi:hypothetical protein E2C01_033132 [Portunus trituberculatus]|uniref:Uncharacterized protein n=1 Tax=Portunus trituberculatus TaxID=210409 RepID=A0A5B7EX14_PORTR|nr:hypothetical protein [Portunus trituberculatus]
MWSKGSVPHLEAAHAASSWPSDGRPAPALRSCIFLAGTFSLGRKEKPFLLRRPSPCWSLDACRSDFRVVYFLVASAIFSVRGKVVVGLDGACSTAAYNIACGTVPQLVSPGQPITPCLCFTNHYSTQSCATSLNFMRLILVKFAEYQVLV